MQSLRSNGGVKKTDPTSRIARKFLHTVRSVPSDRETGTWNISPAGASSRSRPPRSALLPTRRQLGAARACRARRRTAPSAGAVTIADVLRNVLLALLRLRPCARRQALEVRRQSARPAEPRPAVPARHRCRRRVLRSRPAAEAADPPRRARQGGMDGRHLGRGVLLHRRPDEQDQGAIRPRVGRDVQPRHRPVLPPARAEVAGAPSTSPARRSRNAAVRATSASR